MKDLIINFILWLLEVAAAVIVILIVWSIISYLSSLFLLHFNWSEFETEITLTIAIIYQSIILTLLIYMLFYK